MAFPGDFNPRSREGSDPGIRAPAWDHRDFNPRSREGSDLRDLLGCRSLQFQSTLP